VRLFNENIGRRFILTCERHGGDEHLDQTRKSAIDNIFITKRRRKMKFLTIGSLKDIYYTLPPSERGQLLEASVNYIKQEKKAGRILEFYFLVGWNRVASISELSSAQAVYQHLNSSPIGTYMNYETYPLADLDEAVNIMLERYKLRE
jgi:hypothetical protein